MNCWHCDRPAVGVCVFCGRAVCRDHTQTMPNIISSYQYEDKLFAISVDDTLYCGICKPREEPVEIVNLKA